MATRCLEQYRDVAKRVASSRRWDKVLLRHSQVPFLLVVAFGFVVRFFEYVRNDSLTLDESLLALNIVSRSLGQLLHPLRFEQSAPPLFLWAERITINALGVSERTLRFIPLIAGAAFVYGTWKLALRFANIQVAALTAAFMAVSPCMVQYSTQAKQYGIDAAVSVLLAILTLRVAEKPGSKRWLILLLSGIFAIGLSMSAVFVLAGVWFGLLAVRRVREKPGAACWFLSTAVTWAAGFGVSYVSFYSSIANNSYMRHFWMGTFLSDRSGLFGRISYVTFGLVEPLFVHASAGLRSANTLPLMLALTAIVVPAVFGMITLVQRFGLLPISIFCVPVLSAVAASALGLWIFTARLMLYTTPFLGLLIAVGLWRLCEAAPRAILLAIGSLGFASLFQTASEHLNTDRLEHPLLAVIFSIIAGLAIAWTFWQICTWSQFTREKINFLVASSGLLALPTIAVLVGALHVQPDGPKTLIRALTTRSRPTDSIYIASRALPPWLFYTTNWAKTDNTRAARLMEAATSIGPNSGNAASRGHEARNEGNALKFNYRDGLELVGAATGMQNTALGQQVGKLPDSRWADNEAQRIHAAAAPRIWVLVSYFPDVATQQLLDAIALVRGKELLREETNDSTLVLYEFPPASSQIDENDGRDPAGSKSRPKKSRHGLLPAKELSYRPNTTP